jgi:hypothetical protein
VAANSNSDVYVDRSSDYIGPSRREFASHVVSRRPRRRCNLQLSVRPSRYGLRRHSRGDSGMSGAHGVTTVARPPRSVHATRVASTCSYVKPRWR